MRCWGIPPAICAFLIHGFRLYLLDRKLDRELRGNANAGNTAAPAQRAQPAAGDQSHDAPRLPICSGCWAWCCSIVGGMIVTDKEHPRRLTAGGFWILYALIFLIGDKLPPAVVGVVVIVMALIAGFGGATAGKARVLSLEARKASAARPGKMLFVPALTIPVITVIITLSASHLVFGGVPLIEKANVTLIGFGIGCVIALAIA